MGSSDDPSIRDECKLLRRIPITKDFVVWDDNLNRLRPSSASFRDHPNGSSMSIVLGDDLDDAGRSYSEVLKNHKDFALASITAELARENKQAIVRDPLEEEPAHGLVIGKKRRADSRMAKAAQWIISPTEGQLSAANLSIGSAHSVI